MLKKLTAAILSMLIVLSCSITVFAADGEVTVTYDCNGGTFANSETTKEVVYTLDENGQVTLKNNPPLLRDGYLFKGWYTDAECTNPANQKDKYMTGEAKLYAGWYKISDVDIAPDDTSTSVTKADGSELVGVQMRMTDAGLRFVSRISRRIKTDLAKLSDDKVKYGSMLALSDDLPTGTMLTDSAKKSSGEAFNKFYAEKNYYVTRNYALYTDVVINITIDKFKTRIACRPFVEYTDANGFTQTYYYTEPETSSHYLGGGYAISLYELAEYINENTDMEQDQKDILKKYIIDNYDEYLKYNDPADDDGDGLTNGEEYQYGTDKDKVDTDGDGLNDKLEIDLGYDPLKVDSFGDGINDGDRDYDNDGLTNLQEISLKTDLQSADTDNDGINDGDEVNKYGTDPLKKDTDGDGFYDYDEIKAGTDPLDANSPGTGGTIDVPAIVINAPSNPLLEEPKKRKEARSADDGTVTYHDPEEEKNHTPGVKEIFEVDPGEEKGVVVGTIPALDEGKDTKDQTDLYKYNPKKCYVEKYKTNGSTVELTKGKYYIIKGYDYDLSLASLSKMLNVPDYTTADEASLSGLTIDVGVNNSLGLWYNDCSTAWKDNVTRDESVEIKSRSSTVLAALDGLADVINDTGASGDLRIGGSYTLPTKTYPYPQSETVSTSELSSKAHKYAEIWDGIKDLLDNGVSTQLYSGKERMGKFSYVNYDGEYDPDGENISYYDCDSSTSAKIAPCDDVVAEKLTSPEYSVVVDRAQYEADNWKEPETWLLGSKPFFRPSVTPISTIKTREAAGSKYLGEGDQDLLSEKQRNTTYNFYSIDYYDQAAYEKEDGEKFYESSYRWGAGTADEDGYTRANFRVSDGTSKKGYYFSFITDPDSKSAYDAVNRLLTYSLSDKVIVNDNLTAFEIYGTIYVTPSATKEDVAQLIRRVIYKYQFNSDTDGDGIDDMSKDYIVNGDASDIDWSYVFSDSVAVPKASNVGLFSGSAANSNVSARSANTNIVSTGSVTDTITATSGSSTDENILKPEQVLTRDETINTRDWDGDGLYDGDEIKLITQYTTITNKASLEEIKALMAKTGIVSVNAVNKYFDPDGKNELDLKTTFVNMISDPCSKDGDKDGIADVKTDENGEIVRNPKVTKVKSSWGYEMEYPEGQPVRLDPLPMDPTSTGTVFQNNGTYKATQRSLIPVPISEDRDAYNEAPYSKVCVRNEFTLPSHYLFNGYSYSFNTDWFIDEETNLDYIESDKYNGELSNFAMLLASLAYRNNDPCTCTTAEQQRSCTHDKSCDEYTNFVCTDGNNALLTSTEKQLLKEIQSKKRLTQEDYETYRSFEERVRKINKKEYKELGTIEQFLERMGCKYECNSLWDDSSYSNKNHDTISEDPHRGQAYYALKPVEYKDADGNKKTKYIVFVAIRGTWGSPEEWISNGSIGANEKLDGFCEGAEKYGLYGYVKDWNDPEAHLGFDVYASRVYRGLIKFLEKQNGVDSNSDISFLVTGHSRGAAVANLVGKKLLDKDNVMPANVTPNGSNTESLKTVSNKFTDSTVYTYTFAAPNNTTASNVGDSKYNSIFNIVNEKDPVPYVAPAQWGFSKYGRTFTMNFSSALFSDIYGDSSAGIDSRNFLHIPTLGMSTDAIKRIMGEASKLGADRNNLYTYLEDGRNTYEPWFNSEEKVKNALNSAPELIKGLAEIHAGSDNSENYPNDTDKNTVYFYTTAAYHIADILCMAYSGQNRGEYKSKWTIKATVAGIVLKRFLENIWAVVQKPFNAHMPGGYLSYMWENRNISDVTLSPQTPAVGFGIDNSGVITSVSIPTEKKEYYKEILSIPTYINGTKVTGINCDLAADATIKKNTTHLILPSGINAENISANAFNNFNSLAKIEFPVDSKYANNSEYVLSHTYQDDPEYFDYPTLYDKNGNEVYKSPYNTEIIVPGVPEYVYDKNGAITSFEIPAHQSQKNGQSITVPSKIGGTTITKLDCVFGNETTQAISEITVPSSISEIRSTAFGGLAHGVKINFAENSSFISNSDKLVFTTYAANPSINHYALLDSEGNTKYVFPDGAIVNIPGLDVTTISQ